MTLRKMLDQLVNRSMALSMAALRALGQPCPTATGQPTPSKCRLHLDLTMCLNVVKQIFEHRRIRYVNHIKHNLFSHFSALG